MRLHLAAGIHMRISRVLGLEDVEALPFKDLLGKHLSAAGSGTLCEHEWLLPNGS